LKLFFFLKCIGYQYYKVIWDTLSK